MKNSKNFSNLIKLVLSLILFFYSYLVQIIPILIFNINTETASPNTKYALQLFSNTFLLIALFFIYRKELIEEFKKFKKNFWEMSDTAVKYWMIGLLVMAISNILIGTFSPTKIANNEKEVQNIITTVPIISIFLTTILAPLNEEIIFRKSIKNTIKPKIPYILTSGLLFGSLHVITNITSLYDYLYIIPYSALGLAFAKINYETDNVFPCVLVHMIHNGALTMFSILGAGMLL